MKSHLKVVLAVGALALSVAPAMALASPPANQGTAHNHPQSNGNGNGPNYTTSPPPQAKAYGHYCSEQGASKKRVPGQTGKGTPFSQCVTGLAHAAHNPNLSPGQACKAASKKHVKGQKGTPFSQCVVAAAHMRRDEQQQSSS